MHKMFDYKKKCEVIIISGPSGVGKGTIIKELLRAYDVFSLAVSATTRSPRKGEVDKKDYHFLSNESFDQKIKENAFVEWCNVHEYRYGTLKSEINRINNIGKIVLLEVDVQGAIKARDSLENPLLVFIKPPHINDLEYRLNQRQTDTKEVIEKRLKVAVDELTYTKHYDSVIINDKIVNAVKKIETLIKEII